MPGVSACEVNLADRTARVWIEPNRAAVRDVVSAIRASGYGARIARPESADRDRAPDSLRRRLTVSAALTAPLLVLAMADGMLQFPGSVWVQFGLALPVVVYGGAPFYSAAWLAARHGRVDMNTLIAMGTGAAFLYSIVATVAPELVSASAGSVYYETAAAILTLVLLGRVLESRASRRTSASIRKLLALQAKSVHVRREGVEIEIPLERVVVGDEVVVRPGERIPVDGTVVEGEGAVDESHVTGESVPSDKRRGSRVTSGSLNQNGFLVFRAESVGSDTALSRIIDFVPAGTRLQGPGCQARGQDCCRVRTDRLRHRHPDVCRLDGRRPAGGPASQRVDQRRQRPDHCLPLRGGTGHAGSTGSGNRPSGRIRNPDPGRCSARGCREC